MPIMVEHIVRASDVRRDDVLTYRSVTYTVLNVDRKPVWVYVTYVGGTKPLRIRATEDVAIERGESTPEELENEKTEYFVALFKRNAAKSITRLAEARTKLIANLDWRPDYHAADYQSFVAAQTIASLYTRVYQNLESDSDIVTLSDAVRAVESDIRTDLIDARHSSGSTSFISNVVDAIVLDAKRTWLRSGITGW